MAWRCTGNTNAELVANLETAKIVHTPAVRDAMLRTDRAIYVPPVAPGTRRSATYQYGPYADAPQALGHKVTVSAPFIHAVALEALADRLIQCEQPRLLRVLDVGSGSGILLAYLARVAIPSSSMKVVGIEVIPDLVERAITNLKRDGFEPNQASSGVEVVVRHGDGWEGAVDLGPFDCIHVGAFVSSLPTGLLEQLRNGGRMVIPIGDRVMQEFTQVDKDCDGHLTFKTLRTVRFVPLVSKDQEADSDFRGQTSADAATAALAVSFPGPDRDVSTVDWNARYTKGWAYGKKPSQFLVKASADYLVEPRKILLLYEGQGRNAAYLAGKGHHCTIVDSSHAGLTKATLLAKQREVSDMVVPILADLNSWSPPENSFDAVISIFGTAIPAARARLHRACIRALRPGGVVIVEAFSPRHALVRRKNALGPSADKLVSTSMLVAEFAGLQITLAKEAEVQLNEGKFHRGPAVLTWFVAHRSDGASHMYQAMMDAVFQERVTDVRAAHSREAVCQSVIDNASSQLESKTEDTILSNAAAAVHMSTACSLFDKLCRYCWVSSVECICAKIRPINPQVISSKGRNYRVQFKILCHPAEFLRSTSSAKLAALAYSTEQDCEMLVVGAECHEGLISAILSHPGPKFVLYPGSPEESVTVEEFIAATDADVEIDVPDASQNKMAVTVLVPDGSWQCTRVLLREIERRAAPNNVVRVRLDSAAIASRRSPLIEALKEGQGLGRISTLEAMAFFLSEVHGKLGAGKITQPWLSDDRTSAELLANLDHLVEWIRTHRSRCPHKAGVDKRTLSAWTEQLRVEAESVVAPFGLRHCAVCGETLATAIRLTEHVRGRKHCEQVAVDYLSSCENTSLPDSAHARAVLKRHSTDVLEQSTPEPPDCAIVTLTNTLSSHVPDKFKPHD